VQKLEMPRNPGLPHVQDLHQFLNVELLKAQQVEQAQACLVGQGLEVTNRFHQSSK